ncbi:hypothetical protein [Fusibacter sp. 3D3]|uniref:hypothetical protein n=1 Tax=Fusibacter sp. 3D3 TaxID=1048380 RepID=UPI000852CB8C|nr:hypothetical protein [Fusibacter sp. 3D3]GAU77200.1 hypothetical protein F3D3_1814 [Fusibacter sp. 3D3]
MGKKTSFDMFAIKERLNQAKYEADKANGFKVTTGEKVVHVIVALIAFSILASLTISYQLTPMLHYSIMTLLLILLVGRIYLVLKKK